MINRPTLEVFMENLYILDTLFSAYTSYFDYRHGGSFSRKHVKYDEIERVVAYRKVLKTWSRWVEAHINPKRTTVLFMSVSPVHMQ